jgi:malonyl-CoA O-methyltransferase
LATRYRPRIGSGVDKKTFEPIGETSSQYTAFMTAKRPPTLDPVAADRWAKVPALLEKSGSPWLHEEVARRMESRLQWLVKQPRQWLHWEPLRGGVQAHALLAKRYPKSECFVMQESADPLTQAHQYLSPPWWSFRRWVGPSLRFDAPKRPVQMLWANMALHMSAQPQALITQWSHLLESDGFAMFSCLGPDTLRELRPIYAAMGWPAPAHEFTDMHDWGDMLVGAGFAEPVMDMERITLTFSSPERLLDELRGLGRNLHVGRFQHLRGKEWLKKLHAQLQTHLTDPEDPQRLRLTFEIIYGHAFKPQPRIPVKAETTLSMDEMRAVLKSPKGVKNNLF